MMSFLKRVISWPFSESPKGCDAPGWRGNEREEFYGLIEQKKYYSALQVIRTKQPQYSIDEMGDLMKSLESDILEISNRKLV